MLGDEADEGVCRASTISRALERQEEQKRTDMPPPTHPLRQVSLPRLLELWSQARIVSLLAVLQAIRVRDRLGLPQKLSSVTRRCEHEREGMHIDPVQRDERSDAIVRILGSHVLRQRRAWSRD